MQRYNKQPETTSFVIFHWDREELFYIGADSKLCKAYFVITTVVYVFH
jgi:hypothetical protein